MYFVHHSGIAVALYITASVTQEKIVGMRNKMKELCKFAWRMIVEMSLVLRTGLALLDYFARHHL